MPRFATTCEAERPSARSAERSCCLRSEPKRVAPSVIAKTTRRIQNMLISRAANRKAMAHPVRAPLRFTPRVYHATRAKAVGIPSAINKGMVPSAAPGDPQNTKMISRLEAAARATMSEIENLHPIAGIRFLQIAAWQRSPAAVGYLLVGILNENTEVRSLKHSAVSNQSLS